MCFLLLQLIIIQQSPPLGRTALRGSCAFDPPSRKMDMTFVNPEMRKQQPPSKHSLGKDIKLK
jgi:hypothetical protein